MYRGIEKYKIKKFGKYMFVLLFVFLFPMKITNAIPVPHGIDGIIYELDGITQVRKGIDFYVHDTTNGQIIYGKTGYGSSGRYSVSLKGNDGDIVVIKARNRFNQVNATLTLNGVMRNVNLLLNMSFPPIAPVITSQSITNAIEDQLYTYQVEAFDENDDLLKYSLPDYPLGMSIDASGLIMWTPSNVDIGNHSVIVQVSDGLFEVNQSFDIEVQNINDAPMIISIPVINATQDVNYFYDVDSIDEDNGILIYSLIHKPDGMNINNVSGLISWLPSSSQIGLNNVTIAVSDGYLTAIQKFTISVANVNDLPVITSLPITRAIEDQIYTYDVEAYDIDNDVLTYSLIEYTLGMNINRSNGLVKWLPTNEDVGIHNITISVADDKGFSLQTFALLVENVNDAPIINSTPITEARVGENYNYDVDAYDVDNDLLFYSLVVAPDGMEIDKNNGLIEWKPKGKQVGNNTIVVQVSDGDLIDRQEFYIIVIKNRSLNITLRVEELEERPKDAARISKRVYKYLKIDNINKDDIDNAIINFTVDLNWLNQMEIKYNDVVLTRYTKDEWQELVTENLSKDSKFVYYTAKTKGFSYFAISIKEGINVKSILNPQISRIKVPYKISGIVYKFAKLGQVAKGTRLAVTNLENSEISISETGIGPYTGAYYVLVEGKEGDRIKIKIDSVDKEFFTTLKDTNMDFMIKLDLAVSLIAILSILLLLIIFIKIKHKKRLKMYALILLVLVYFVLFSTLVKAPPPSPHNVDGRVLTNSSNGVQNGIPVTINDTVSGDYVLTYVDAPDVPALRGSYSATINGNDGDLIIVTAWNSTHYGTNNSNLVSTTTNINVVLNTTRQSEANVTIISPANNSLMNKSIIFNVTANITMLGNNGVDCNATIGFSNNQTINISSGENLTHFLGDISLGGYKVTNWSVIGLNNGTSDITVRADCGSDGVKLDKVNSYTIFNITIQNLAPAITRIVLPSPIDLIAGDNLTLFCNATINDNNTASDIKIVNATFYQYSVGSNALDDNNEHYTNNSCINISSSIFEANYSCGFKIVYYANNGSWQCNITVMDYSNVTIFGNISTSINELMAIDIYPTIIDYGSLKVTNISATDVNVTMRNFGNVPINVTVRGFAPNESLAYLNLSMICETGNISNANERFSISNSSVFDSMTRLNNETQLIQNITLHQRTNDVVFGNDTNFTFWKIQIPPLTLGVCNGTVIFSAMLIN